MSRYRCCSQTKGLFPYDNAFDPAWHRGKDLIGNGAELFSEFADGGIIAENGDGVANLAWDSRDIEHTHVHADVPYGWCAVAIDAERGVAASEMPVETVGISAGNGGDDGAFRSNMPVAAVSYGAVFRGEGLDLKDLYLERSHRGEPDVRQGADSVDADAESQSDPFRENAPRAASASVPGIETLLQLPHFTVSKVNLKQALSIDNANSDTSIAYTSVKGAFEVQTTPDASPDGERILTAGDGETVLIPAECPSFILAPRSSDAVLLEVMVEA